ncbi:MAG TPA: DUF998 domain-containing protein [Amycolatopsis sp.]|nr:DUF998 domain-containing protein [Amycolatopsis sp.]
MHSLDALHPATTRAGARGWAIAAIGCFGTSVLLALALQLALNAQVDPIRQVISDYAVFGGEVPFAVSALALAAGALILLVGLSRAGIPLTRPVRALTGAFSTALALCAFFPTTLSGDPPSVPGEIHEYAGAVLFASLPGAAQLLVRHLRRQPSWRVLARRLAIRTRWSWAALALFAASQVPADFPAWQALSGLVPQGLTERVLFLVYLALLGDLSRAVLHANERTSC